MPLKRRAPGGIQAGEAVFKRGRSAPWVPRFQPAAAQRFARGRKADVGTELKFHDLDIDDVVVAATGTIAEDSCVTIAQGTTESTRIGRKCTIRHIGWRMQCLIPAATAAANTSETVRVILYQDKQTNGATATVTGILESADYQSFNQLANKGRFRVLMDRNYDLNSAAGGAPNGAESFSEWGMTDTFFKDVNIPIEYDNSVTTGAIGSVRTNNIGVLTISQAGLGVFVSKMRLRFTDS